MVLTKKHFTRIAEILAKHDASGKMVDSFIDYFRDENPFFDENKFRAYIEELRRKSEHLKRLRLKEVV